MRNNIWLEKILAEVWHDHFADVSKENQVYIVFGRKARRRLASIRQFSRHDKNSNTKILVTGHFQDERVPEEIVKVTIAHELCHYAHGFASPLPKFFRFPHRGDVVDAELRKRGLGDILKFQEQWLKDVWSSIVGESARPKNRTRARRKFRFKLRFFS